MKPGRRPRRERSFAEILAPRAGEDTGLHLEDGSRVAVVGGGPGGAFFAYFLRKMAETVGLDLGIDIFEPRLFTHCGPAGCNHCGGIVSESLVQMLATEGINLPGSVVQRGIDSYVLHMDVGTVRIETPLREKRIAAVFRGNGPRDAPSPSESFDRFLQDLAVTKGARVVRKLVTDVEWPDGFPRLLHADGSAETYDLLALAAGVNSRLPERVAAGVPGYRPPRTVTTYICEFLLDGATVQRQLGASMHVFLLDMPRLEFAALIPKGEVVTLCLLGDDIDQEFVERFLAAPEVRACFPEGLGLPPKVCNCAPRINVGGTGRPFGDRLVALGDAGVTRLYKDGIGASYRTAKAAAVTAVFEGVSARDFERHFWPTCRRIARDNAIGKFIFAFNGQIQHRRFSRRAILRMTANEQRKTGGRRPMSRMLWDLFTGSAPYREVLLNTLHPEFVAKLAWNVAIAAGAAIAPTARAPAGDPR